MELTIKDYMAIQLCVGMGEDERNTINQIIRVLGLEHKPHRENIEYVSKMLTLLNLDKNNFYHKFKFKDKEYGFIPNLEEITTAEWLDLETYQSDDNNIHRLLSILYRPIVSKSGGKYSVAKYNGTHIDFLDLPVKYYIGAMGFFIRLRESL